MDELDKGPICGSTNLLTTSDREQMRFVDEFDLLQSGFERSRCYARVRKHFHSVQ